jgi:hypothetical protein
MSISVSNIRAIGPGTATPDPVDPGSGGGGSGGGGGGAGGSIGCTSAEIANYQCEAGYVLWQNACVNPLDTDDYKKIPHSVGYDFEYYEHAGELIGKYNLIPVSIGGCTVPIYFGQNVKVEKIERMNLKPSININTDESALIMNLNHYDAGVGSIMDIPALTDDSTDNVDSFYFGEFFCLQNTISAIKKINLAYDLVDGKGDPYSSLWDNLRPDFVELPGNDSIDPNAFVEWSFGFARVPQAGRLKAFKPNIDSGVGVTPTVKDPVLGTGWGNWKAMRDTCFAWLRVHDKFNLNEYLASTPIHSDQHVVQVRVRVNQEKLSAFLALAVDSSAYAEPEKEKEYRLVFYPPSFYSFPSDAVDNLVSPNLNSVNTHLDDIIFPVPNNYKTDGNIQYVIEFLTAKNRGDVIFSTSSLGDHASYEKLQWTQSGDKINWRSISDELPSFNNEFEEENGSASESTLFIKYELSTKARAKLLERSDIIFKIKQIDGTLVA